MWLTDLTVLSGEEEERGRFVWLRTTTSHAFYNAEVDYIS